MTGNDRERVMTIFIDIFICSIKGVYISWAQKNSHNFVSNKPALNSRAPASDLAHREDWFFALPLLHSFPHQITWTAVWVGAYVVTELTGVTVGRADRRCFDV